MYQSRAEPKYTRGVYIVWCVRKVLIYCVVCASVGQYWTSRQSQTYTLGLQAPRVRTYQAGNLVYLDAKRDPAPEGSSVVNAISTHSTNR